MKKILILGAGVYQVPLIRRAKAMGLYVTAASRPGPYPGFSLADEVWPYDTTDTAAILKKASETGIDGVCTTGTDVAVRTIGVLNETLGLTGIRSRAARILTDKALMKEAFRGRVSSTPFRVIRKDSDIEEAVSELGFPLMVKACDVSGSRGILRVERYEEVMPAVMEARRVTSADHILMERAAAGVEIGLDGYIRNGKAVLSLPHVKYVEHAGAVTVPVGHSFPYRAPQKILSELSDQLQRIADASGMTDGAVNCDIMVSKDGVTVIEAGGRCGATGIPELIGMHTGIDYYEQILKGALGEEPDFTAVKARPCISRLLMSPFDGVVDSVDEEMLDRVRKKTGADISIDVKPGDQVCAMRNGTDRIGQILLYSGSEQEALQAARGALSCIHITRMV